MRWWQGLQWERHPPVPDGHSLQKRAVRSGKRDTGGDVFFNDRDALPGNALLHNYFASQRAPC